MEKLFRNHKAARRLRLIHSSKKKTLPQTVQVGLEADMESGIAADAEQGMGPGMKIQSSPAQPATAGPWATNMLLPVLTSQERW